MAKRPWGETGWRQLTAAMQRAFVAEAAVSLLLAQDETLTKYKAGKELVEACMDYKTEREKARDRAHAERQP